MGRRRLRRAWIVGAVLAGFVVVGAGGALAAGLAATLWAAPAAAVAAAVAAFAPVAVAALQERSGRRAELERTLVSATSPAVAAPRAASGPADLLRPERGVVEFTGRRIELERLLGWCLDRSAPTVMLLVGAGGVGKTRLAVRLAADLEREGWTCRNVEAGHEVEAVDAARRSGSKRLLLVVDYAETRTGLAGLLDAVGSEPWPAPPRVLLLARGTGEWWDRLEGSTAAAVSELVASSARLPLEPALDPRMDDAEVVRAAVPAFARVLEVPPPERVDVVATDSRMPALVLHAAALVAVLRNQSSRAGRAAPACGGAGRRRAAWPRGRAAAPCAW